MRHWAIAILLGLLASCSSNDTSCVVDEDCFKGEACVDGECGQVPENNVALSNALNNDDGPTSNAPNSEANNTGTSNTTGVCRADPFTSMCPADDNDDFNDYIRMESGRGCPGSFDNFEGGMVEVLDQTMCALETIDKYGTNLLPCDNITFVVEVTVTPKQDCDPGDWDLNMRLQGNDCVEHNDKMRCEDLPDGGKRATGFLEPSISVTTPNIEIIALEENMQFDYDIQLVVRE